MSERKYTLTLRRSVRAQLVHTLNTALGSGEMVKLDPIENLPAGDYLVHSRTCEQEGTDTVWQFGLELVRHGAQRKYYTWRAKGDSAAKMHAVHQSGQPVQFPGTPDIAPGWYKVIGAAENAGGTGPVFTLEACEAPSLPPVAPVVSVPYQPTLADLFCEIQAMRHELAALRARVDSGRLAHGAPLEMRK